MKIKKLVDIVKTNRLLFIILAITLISIGSIGTVALYEFPSSGNEKVNNIQNFNESSIEKTKTTKFISTEIHKMEKSYDEKRKGLIYIKKRKEEKIKDIMEEESVYEGNITIYGNIRRTLNSSDADMFRDRHGIEFSREDVEVVRDSFWNRAQNSQNLILKYRGDILSYNKETSGIVSELVDIEEKIEEKQKGVKEK